MKRAAGVVLSLFLLAASSAHARALRTQADDAPAVEPAPGQLAPSARPSDDIGTGVFYALPGDAAVASFRAHAQNIGVIAPQSFSLDAHGLLRGTLPAGLAAIARQQGVVIMPLVINAGFSRWGAERLLRSPSARDQAIGALVDQARALEVAGWQIDFEGMHSIDRAAFSRFVADAAAALHRHGKLLSVAVAARTDDDPSSDNFRTFSGVYDYTALAHSADFLSIMAYPESDARHPGPLASYPWVEQVVQHVLQEAPGDKISLGLPTYQSDWMERRTRVSVRERIRGKIRHVYHFVYRLLHHNGPVTVAPDDLQWDPVLKASYRITGSGHSLHITWVEDQRSFDAKLHLVAQYHLRGYSVWRIGLESPGIWNQLPAAARNLTPVPPPVISAPALALPALDVTDQP
ncbi:MAG TPA: glycosyl hydrolase family 18 protein [Terriglobales bacterium]|jgi:spore germination protein YaaH